MASSIYELIGRLVVRSWWLRYGKQIKIAAAGIAVLGLAAGYALAKHEPPEG
jgi:hypothetical protein